MIYIKFSVLLSWFVDSTVKSVYMGGKNSHSEKKMHFRKTVGEAKKLLEPFWKHLYSKASLVRVFESSQ